MQMQCQSRQLLGTASPMHVCALSACRIAWPMGCSQRHRLPCTWLPHTPSASVEEQEPGGSSSYQPQAKPKAKDPYPEVPTPNKAI